MKTKLTLIGAALAMLLSSAACTNPETAAGFEGYVYHVPLMFGKMRFERAMKGPATTGVSWRLFVINIDMRKKSYKESFSLLTSDNLSVSFEVVSRIKPKDGQIKDIVEQWGGENWYEWNVREPLRTIVRTEVINVSATDIQLRTQEVKTRIYQKLQSRYEKTPFFIESVDIGEIQFPKEVTDAIKRKIAQKQELERQAFVLQKTTKEAAIRVLEALKVAKQQRIISSTLDPLYVQRKAVQVYRALAESPNKTIMMLPNSPRGTGLPLILTEGKRKMLSAADEKLLREMEVRYMKAATEPAPPMDGSAPSKEGGSKEDGADAASPDKPADGAGEPKPADKPANKPSGAKDKGKTAPKPMLE
ncbi:MAG: hypothetical protein KJO07_22940 [Deltaproteobacteria bacterium]|nr:hypothetical protein [Deltaproteobacteria bacterium]